MVRSHIMLTSSFFVKEREKKKKRKLEVIGGEGDEIGKVNTIEKWL